MSSSAALSTVFESLRHVLAAWGVRGVMSQALLFLVWGRVGQVARQMERLAARFAAGQLWRRVVRPVVMTDVPVVATGAVERQARIWPRKFGWLVELLRWHVSPLGGQLQTVLEQPDMVALLRASPPAGRLLQPLCRMLGLDRSVWRPLPEGFVPEVVVVVAAEVVKRKRAPRPPVDWGRIPLPRGVLTAARRGGFKTRG